MLATASDLLVFLTRSKKRYRRDSPGRCCETKGLLDSEERRTKARTGASRQRMTDGRSILLHGCKNDVILIVGFHGSRACVLQASPPCRRAARLRLRGPYTAWPQTAPLPPGWPSGGPRRLWDDAMADATLSGECGQRGCSDDWYVGDRGREFNHINERPGGCSRSSPRPGRNVVREFNPDRKEPHWGKRKLKWDQ
jgi:hypothetical protein